MPAKKGERRVQETTAADLRDYAARLRKAANLLTQAAGDMDAAKQKSAGIEGHKSMEESFGLINKFIGNCNKKVSRL